MKSLRLIGITGVVLALAGLTGCSASRQPARPVTAQAVAPTPAPAVIETFRGVPLPPAAQHTQDVWLDVHIYRIDGATWEQVRDWYIDQMPRYGWNTLKCGGQPVPGEYHSVFGTGTGGRAAIGLRAQPQYTELMIQTEVMAGAAGATCEGPR